MSKWNVCRALVRPSCLTALALILTVSAGCGSGITSPVRGRVVFKDGSPLTGGLVLFRPVDEKLQVSARGDIEEDGSFILGTYKVGDGAIPGKYQVAITPPPRPKVREKPVGRRIIHPRYEKHETSGLEFEVKRGDNNFTIEVEKP
ncbi:MAG TPA: hypothetical protein VKU02_17555 [Gemmataceae bacterium]|nr:hypothetical protein [Gemmataceae bacterium]